MLAVSDINMAIKPRISSFLPSHQLQRRAGVGTFEETSVVVLFNNTSDKVRTIGLPSTSGLSVTQQGSQTLPA